MMDSHHGIMQCTLKSHLMIQDLFVCGGFFRFFWRRPPDQMNHRSDVFTSVIHLAFRVFSRPTQKKKKKGRIVFLGVTLKRPAEKCAHFLFSLGLLLWLMDLQQTPHVGRYEEVMYSEAGTEVGWNMPRRLCIQCYLFWVWSRYYALYKKNCLKKKVYIYIYNHWRYRLQPRYLIWESWLTTVCHIQ